MQRGKVMVLYDWFGAGGIILFISTIGMLVVVLKTVTLGVAETQMSALPPPAKLRSVATVPSSPAAQPDEKQSGFLPEHPLEAELINQAAKVGIIEQIGDNGTIRRSVTLWLRDPMASLPVPGNTDLEEDDPGITIMGQKIESV